MFHKLFSVRVICFVFTALAFTTILFPAAHADDPEYLVEYRRYKDALEDGKLSKAAVHGLTAWTKAETELGDHNLTGILAYNYGKLVVFDNVEAALPALHRAEELFEAGIAELPAEELALYVSYAEFANDKQTFWQAENLRKALKAYAPFSADNPDPGNIWLILASEDLNSDRYSKAIKSAANAEAELNKTDPGNYIRKAQAIIIGAVATLVPYPRKVHDVQAAHNEFVRAQHLFPPQKDIDTFDPTFALAMGWDAAASSALLSLGKEQYPDHKDEGFDPKTEYPQRFAGPYREEEECKIDWERKPPKYPQKELRKGYLGAVLIGYHMAQDGTIRSPRILAEAPKDTFGPYVLKSMETWRATELPEDKLCLRNLITQVTFVIK